MKMLFNILALAIVLAGSGVGLNQTIAAGPAGKKKAHDVLTLQDGVLIDLVEKAIFVPKAEGGIEAIDIATGNTLWKTKKEDGTYWPVAVHGRTLGVRVRDKPLRIGGLDLDAKGKRLWITEPVLPEWVKGPEWLKEVPKRNRKLPEWVPEPERSKPRSLNRDLQLAVMDAISKARGTYRCEERIEKGEFVMRWQAAN